MQLTGTFHKLFFLAHLSIASGKTLRTAGGAPGEDANNVSERSLQSLPTACNVVYQTLTSATIQAMLTLVLSPRSEYITEASTIVEEMIPLIEFDVQLMKVSSIRLATKIDVIFNSLSALHSIIGLCIL